MMRAASLGPTPGRVVSCSTEAVLMLTLPAGAGLTGPAATARPVVRLRAKATARAVATMRFSMQSPFDGEFPGIRDVETKGTAFGWPRGPALPSLAHPA